jgi:hypothetical protein
MKKLFSLALLLVLALPFASLAAVKTAPAAPAPVRASNAGDLWAGKLAVGGLVMGGPITCVGIGSSFGVPVLQYHFNKDVMGTVGASYFSGNNVTNTVLLGKLDYTLGQAGSVMNNIGGFVSSVSTTNFQTSTTLGGTWGFRTLLQPNLALSTDIVIFAINSVGGTSTTMVLPGAIFAVAYYI